MHNIFLDIETLPVQCPERRAKLIAEAKPPANMSKPETIAKWREENADAIIAKTSFDPAAGHICSIAWAVGDGEVQSLRTICVEDEGALLHGFFESLPTQGLCRPLGEPAMSRYFVTGEDDE